MRIKKKHVIKEARINEAMLLDKLDNIKPNIKRILKLMYKKYIPKDEEERKNFKWWRLSETDIREDLEESLGISKLEAFKLARYFVNHGEVIFNEMEYDVQTSEIYKEVLADYITKLSKERNNWPDLLFDVNINGRKYKWDDYEYWDGYRSFAIYLGYNVNLGSGVLMQLQYDFNNKNQMVVIKSTISLEFRDDKYIIELFPPNTVIDLPDSGEYEPFVEWMQGIIADIQVILSDKNINTRELSSTSR